MVSLKTSRAGKLWPVPEILEGERPFTLRETSKRESMVCTDLVGKVMSVPTSDDAFGRMGRMHEMAHVAITPTEGMQIAQERGIGSDYINVAEDMRVNIFLRRKFTLEASVDEKLFKHTLEGYALNNDLKGATLMAVACWGVPEYETLLKFFDKEKPEWYYPIRDVVDQCQYFLGYDNKFEKALKVAKYLQDQFNPEVKELEDKADELGIPAEILAQAKSDTRDGYSDVDWGIMEIKRPALTEHMSEKRLNRRIKPMDTGSSLMFPSRLDVDDKVFGNIKRVAKGTVLIDVSSSMSMDPEDIRDMVQAAPGVTVACYSGAADSGHLTIIAAKGNMMKFPKSTRDWDWGNIVDGPALKWLAGQAEPRVWVCDGFVTGVDDVSTPALTLEAYKIVADNKIRRTGEIRQAPKLLKK